MPKLKIKYYGEKFEPESEGLTESTGKIKYSDKAVDAPESLEALSKKKKKKGKIMFIRTKKPVKENIIDARGNTRDTLKEGMEEERLKKEKEIGRRIRLMK